MRLICIDRALGNQTWVQVVDGNSSIVLYVKHTHQPSGFEAMVYQTGDAENYLRILNAGIHRAVVTYLEHFFPRLKREAYNTVMEWEC